MKKAAEIFLVALQLAITFGANAPTSPNVVIDGYTVNSTLNSPAFLPLGTTVILVCRISGIPHRLQTNYHWTCPNGSCQQTGYAGRKINNNIIAINITSTSDGGTYTCTVTAEGREASQQFQLNVTDTVGYTIVLVHSYGRLIANGQVITDLSEIAQPDNITSRSGRVICVRGVWYWNMSKNSQKNSLSNPSTLHPITTWENKTVYQILGENSTLVVTESWTISNNIVYCSRNDTHHHRRYVYLFPRGNESVHPPNIDVYNSSTNNNKIVLNSTFNKTRTRTALVGYTRLDLGVPLQGKNARLTPEQRVWRIPVAPGATYRIVAWGMKGTRNRSQLPRVLIVKTMESTPSPPRHLNITGVFDDGIELNWIPPREPNGGIRHYIIKYTTQNGTQQEINTTNNINYYNLTGLESGQTYFNITVVAVNSAGGGGGSQPITSYVHNPTVESTNASEELQYTHSQRETAEPGTTPTTEPSTTPTAEPGTTPTTEPDTTPTAEPSTTPTAEPSTTPTAEPGTTPTAEPKTTKTAEPSTTKTAEPSTTPTTEPSTTPTTEPSTTPTSEPSTTPTAEPNTPGANINRNAIIGGSVATAVLVIVALALIAMCVATRKGKNGEGTDQQDNANRQPYYRMPMGGIYNNIQENTYSRIQREEQPPSNQSYSVIYHQDSDDDESDPHEGNRRTGSVSIIRNLSSRYGNRGNRHSNGNNGSTEGDKEPLYSQPRKKPKGVTTPVARGVVVDCDLFHTQSEQDNRSGVNAENLSSTPPESLYSQVRDVKLLPLDLSVKDDITPSVIPLPTNTRDN